MTRWPVRRRRWRSLEVGLTGAVIGVAEAEAWEGSLVPTMLVAVTVTV